MITYISYSVIFFLIIGSLFLLQGINCSKLVCNNDDNNIKSSLSSKSKIYYLFPIANAMREEISNTSTTYLYDDFENSSTYTLKPGQTSPDGKWVAAHTGYGPVGVRQDPISDNHYLLEKPHTSTSSNETHSSLMITTKQYSDFEIDVDMKTLAQLRQNSPPEPWETAWILWHRTDQFHWYAFSLKTNGFQVEKKDNDRQDDNAEIYLNSNLNPNVKIGQWQHVKIRHEGSITKTPHIQIWVDNVKIVDFVDKNKNVLNSAKMSYGSIGLYNEDSWVVFDNIYIRPL